MLAVVLLIIANIAMLFLLVFSNASLIAYTFGDDLISGIFTLILSLNIIVSYGVVYRIAAVFLAKRVKQEMLATAVLCAINAVIYLYYWIIEFKYANSLDVQIWTCISLCLIAGNYIHSLFCAYKKYRNIAE